MKLKWEVDTGNVVEATFGALGKEVVSVNGQEVCNRRRRQSSHVITFALSDGRPAQIEVVSAFIGQPTIRLRVAGELMAPTTKDVLKCDQCAAVVKPNDKFCDRCGHTLATAEHREQQTQVKSSAVVIRTLAWLFAVSGVVMFFLKKAQSSDLLRQLDSMSPETPLDPIDGKIYTAAELRHELMWEIWSVLVTNLVLAAVMAGLSVWAKRAPLQAMLVALATYVVVIATNVMIDPSTLAQGLLLKVVIIAMFAKGIRAALALRAANA